MDDALRAPAGLPWITMTPLSTAPTFAHNLHSLHHYEKEPLKAKIQDTREETAAIKCQKNRNKYNRYLGDARRSYGLLAFF